MQAELDPARARLEGQLRLVVGNRERSLLRELVLRLYPEQRGAGTSLKVDSVQVNGKPAASRARGTVLEVTLAPPLEPGRVVALTLTFHGKLRRLRDADDDPLSQGSALLAQLAPGLGALSGRPVSGGSAGHATFAVGPDGATLVDWYPQLAARSRGAWDRAEPGPLGDAGHAGRAEPCAAIVALTVPKGWHVAGAGSALGQHPVADGKEAATFAAAGIRGALGLVAAQDYTELSDDVAHVHLRVSSLHGDEGARGLLSCARTALASLERHFGPYPWTNLAVAETALTGGAAGVELPGLALLSRTLSPQAHASAQLPAGMLEFTCFHQVAHQWWQAVVGSDPQRAPWVDEGLAQYSAVLVEEDAKGGGPAGHDAAEQAMNTFVALNYQGMRLARLPDGPVARPASAFRSQLAYAGLVDGKAPLFYARARELLGDVRFDLAAREYRRSWAFREAGEGAWLAAAQRISPEHKEELAQLEKRWLHERRGDEDIPPPDALTLLDSLGGNGTPAGAGVSALLRALQGAQRAASQPSEPELRDALRALQKMMPGLARMLDEAGPPDDAGDDAQAP